MISCAKVEAPHIKTLFWAQAPSSPCIVKESNNKAESERNPAEI